MNERIAQELQTTLIKLEYEPFSYSGMGMGGRTCLAVQIGDIDKLLYLGMGIALHMGIGDALHIGIDADDCTNCKTDTFGQGYVVYWPTMPYDPQLEDSDATMGLR